MISYMIFYVDPAAGDFSPNPKGVPGNDGDSRKTQFSVLLEVDYTSGPGPGSNRGK